MNPFISAAIGSVVRHSLSALGGYFLAYGLSDDVVNNFVSSTEPLALGLISVGASQIWSLIQKKRSAK